MEKNLKKALTSVLFVLAFGAIFVSGVYYGSSSKICETCQPTDVNFSLFWDAYNLIKTKFVDSTKVTNEAILYGAISGMAESLGDPYTTFFNPTEAKKFTDELSGQFGGIGIEMAVKNGQLTIVAPLENTPAQRAGLRAGDIILEINGEDATLISADEAVTLIRGDVGTKVSLSIYRPGTSEKNEFTITRDVIIIPSLKWELLEGDIAHLELYQFSQNLNYDFNRAAFEILNSPAKKIIIDLRNNPGGYLEISQNIAGWFVEKGKTVVIEDFGAKSEQTIYKSEGNAQFLSYPAVILMNQGSASASEILAGALRDNNKTKIVGETSFGKGSVQEGIDMIDGSFLKITIAKWLTPNGMSISDTGLIPDVAVEMTDEDFAQDKDPQLKKAIELLKNIQ